MEFIFQSAGPGVHCYSPFQKTTQLKSTLNLEEMCKNVILRCVTLRRLAMITTELPLPRRILNYISELSTADFEHIECAPFSDAFSTNFFHRALTYRVICLRDGQEYLISYGHSPVEDAKLKNGHHEWVKVQHKNIMSICATVKEPSTENVFYVYDKPYASLEQMWNIFCERDHPVPSSFFYHLTIDLIKALEYIQASGLHYNRFGLDNIFILNDRLVLENGLMRKSIKFLRHDSKACSRSELGDVARILKLLLQDCDSKLFQSETLQALVRAFENKCIESMLKTFNYSEESMKSFSYIKMIENLKC